LIIDGGPATVGIESTVLDLSVSPARLLRPGMIDAEALVAVAGQLNAPGQAEGTVLKSPGQLPKHYAPRAKLLTLSWSDDANLKAQLANLKLDPRTTHVLAHSRVPTGTDFGRTVVMPHTSKGFARALYAELHRCDEEGARTIIVEALPQTPEWQALADRLARAAA
jgi:L-threonylcarbamoyladenylate synthase